MPTYNLMHGDCREQLKHLADNSIDSIVCDPPYELGFMGKKWDSTGIAYDLTVWTECLRVLKPGGHLIAFGGTRTYHRMTVAIEDAGFEIRECIMWIFGSGFPKSHDVSKALDKQAGAEREVVGKGKPMKSLGVMHDDKWQSDEQYTITAPATDLAKQWHGWGTSLKPAYEPAVLARKPLIGTVADNVTTWGVGGLNIDGCRVETSDNLNGGAYAQNGTTRNDGWGMQRGNAGEYRQPIGRWPANVILDESAGEALDEQSGISKSAVSKKLHHQKTSNTNIQFNGKAFAMLGINQHDDIGGASRFFYTAKASKSEREAGLDGTCTVKYNIDRSILGGLSWNDVSTVVAQLLQKVTSELATLKWLIDESGASITVLYPSDSSFITSMETSKTTALKICNSLMCSLISESTADANCEMESGSNHAKSVEQLRAWILTTTNGKTELALGAVNVALTTLQQINENEPSARNNSHSTVKPIALMRYLVRLVTPKGGTVLDPFMGSGSTGCASMCEEMNFIGIELNEEYVEIAKRRIEHWLRQSSNNTMQQSFDL